MITIAKLNIEINGTMNTWVQFHYRKAREIQISEIIPITIKKSHICYATNMLVSNNCSRFATIGYYSFCLSLSLLTVKNNLRLKCVYNCGLEFLIH